MTQDPAAIRVERTLAHPTAAVWRALTEPSLVEKWLMPGDIAPQVGHRFELRTDPIPQTGFSGRIACEVLEAEPERRLSHTWSDALAPEGMRTTVTWTLQEDPAGTRLTLEQAGFDPQDPQQAMALKAMDGGWRHHVLGRLEKVLDAGLPTA